MPASNPSQVRHDRLDVIAAHDKNEPPSHTEAACRRPDPRGKRAVRDIAVIGDDRDAVAVGSQVAAERSARGW